MKKLIGLVAIIIVAILGSYYATGVITERTLKKNIATLSDPQQLHMQFTEYHRGWFKSKAALGIKAHIPAQIVKNAQGQATTIAAQDFTLSLPIIIDHGPFIFSKDGLHFGMGYAQTVVDIPPEYRAQYDEIFTKDSEKPQLKASIFVNYLVRSTLKFGIPAFHAITKEQNIKFDWKGLRSTSKISLNMDRLVGDVRIKGLDVHKDQELEINMGTFDVDYNLKKITAGIFLGPTNLSFHSLAVKAKGQDPLNVFGVKINSDSGIDNDLFHASINASFDKIEAQKKVYGPGEFDFSIKNLDSAALLKIHQQAMSMQQTTNEAQHQQQVMAMLPEIPALFGKGPELEISKLKLTMPEGVIEGNLKLWLPQEENSNPFKMLQKIQGNGKLSIPMSVLKMLMQRSAEKKMAAQSNTQQVLMQELQKDNVSSAQPTPAPSNAQLSQTQVDTQIANLLSSGLITQDGDNYVSSFEFKEGKLTINGKPFNQTMLH